MAPAMSRPLPSKRHPIRSLGDTVAALLAEPDPALGGATRLDALLRTLLEKAITGDMDAARLIVHLIEHLPDPWRDPANPPGDPGGPLYAELERLAAYERQHRPPNETPEARKARRAEMSIASRVATAEGAEEVALAQAELDAEVQAGLRDDARLRAMVEAGPEPPD